METVTAAVEYLEGINLASITMRIVMSMVCGGVIGIERGKAHQRPECGRTCWSVWARPWSC